MKVLFATSEVSPFAKTGGLADVTDALPRALHKLGHEPLVFLPAYRQTLESGRPITPTGIGFDIQVGSKRVHGELLESRLRGGDVPVYLVAQDDYFDRPALYRQDGRDYIDNCERFVFFCRSVLHAVELLDLQIDIIHCNDWQTGLIPAYLRIERADDPRFRKVASLLTIHNLAYQGCFWHWDMLLTGLDWKYFNWHQMEFHGQLSLLKTGVVFADALSTVSPQYAKEIQRPPLGCSLEGVLRHRHDVLFGILNGVDYDTWNPASDLLIDTTYDATNWQAGKAASKAALQRELGLPTRPDTPLFGLIGRLADQKGWDLVAEVMRHWLDNADVQWAILGTGEPEYHTLLNDLSRSHQDKLAVRLEFSDGLAHQIEAGADMFLMASRYEPCGLNQLYSLKYGTVPIVNHTGGLVDTITDATPERIADGTANGFVMPAYDPTHLDATLGRACQMFHDAPEQWARLVDVGMNQDWSWDRSAQQYADLYHRIATTRAG